MASEVGTLHELGVLAGERYGDQKSIGYKNGTEWAWVTFAERAAQAKKTTALLESVGVTKGDRVAVISKNRIEWASCAYGTYGADAAFVPMYEQQQPSDWEYILRDSEAKVLFVSRKDLLLGGALKAFEASPQAKAIYCFDDDGEYSLRRALAELHDGPGNMNVPTKNDLATLIYTSGTTGKPKGVELTHWNLTWNACSVKDQCREQIMEAKVPYIRSLSILPWAHIYGQTVELHGMLAMGGEMGLAEDATTFVNECNETKPTVLMAVPALYNRIFDNFQKQKSHMPTWKAHLAERALELGDKKAKNTNDPTTAPELSFFEKAEFALMDKLVLSKVRDALGGEVKCLASGGAAIASEVRVFLEAVGFKLTNGYGLTETSPVLTQELSHDKRNRHAGSIGRPLPGVSVKTVDEDNNDTAIGAPGEIVVAGPGIMRGYWGQPEATKEVLFEKDGVTWFKTGDRGVLELVEEDDVTSSTTRPNIHVRIVGRIKEQYKLANGKYVVPTPIEEAFARSRFISQVFLYGDNKPFNVALVSPDWTAIEDEFEEGPMKILQPFPFNFQPPEAIEDLFEKHHDKITALISRELHNHNQCKNYEFPKKWTILTQGFNVARSMLTPKLSLRRNIVLQDHQHLVENMYDEEDAIHEATFCHTKKVSDHSRSSHYQHYVPPQQQQSMKL